MRADVEIEWGVRPMNQSSSAGDCQCSCEQVTEGWIQEGCISAGALSPLPAASSHTGQSALEVALSELMVPSGLAAAEVLRMQKPGGLAPMGQSPPPILGGTEAVHVILATPRNYHTTSDETLRRTRHL